MEVSRVILPHRVPFFHPTSLLPNQEDSLLEHHLRNQLLRVPSFQVVRLHSRQDSPSVVSQVREHHNHNFSHLPNRASPTACLVQLQHLHLTLVPRLHRHPVPCFSLGLPLHHSSSQPQDLTFLPLHLQISALEGHPVYQPLARGNRLPHLDQALGSAWDQPMRHGRQPQLGCGKDKELEGDDVSFCLKQAVYCHMSWY